MTDKEINPSPEGADLNLQRFKRFATKPSTTNFEGDIVAGEVWQGAHGTCSLFTTNSEGSFATGRVWVERII